jgi:hypothetical protein
MNYARTLQIAFATATCTMVAAQAALAGGEPKNTAPFTRLATHGQSTQVTLSPSAIANARTAIRGEAKNQPPFTLHVGDALARFLSQSLPAAAAEQRGEPKNEAPFTRRAGLGA